LKLFSHPKQKSAAFFPAALMSRFLEKVVVEAEI
jgi:hypothetical protein